MKKCPQCGREYDLSMSFCLDDGSELLYGPASMDGPPTAVLKEMPAFRVGDEATAIFRHSSPAIEPNSIAVLPFAHLSSQPDDEFFCDGLAEEMINALTKIESLKVAARTSAFSFKGTNTNVSEIGQALGVNKIVEGSVRKAGDRVRITVQLVNASDGYQIWSERYDREMKDIFAVQDEITLAVVEALKVKLLRNERSAILKKATDDPEAYQLYLQGRFFWNKRSEEGLKSAIRYFQQAIEMDENYALAWAGIADSYSLLGEFGNIPRKDLLPKFEDAVQRALELDDSLAEVHTSLARLLWIANWDWEGAAREFERALELNPNYATAHHWYSQWFLSMGRLDEALQMITRATELDPVSQAIMKDKGLILYYRREYDETIEFCGRTLELDPNYSAAHRLLSLAYQAKGQFDQAIDENQKWGKLTGNQTEADFALAQIYASSGDREEALRLVRAVENKKHVVSNFYRGLALVYTALGDDDRAFDLLDESYKLREEALLNTKVDQKLERLRSDPRFAALLEKIGVA